MLAQKPRDIFYMQHHARNCPWNGVNAASPVYIMYIHLGLGSNTEKIAVAMVFYRHSLSFSLWAGNFQLVWKAEPWLFCCTAPSKVWSAPIHVSQNIFGMLAIKWCLPPAAMGWVGLWRRIVSLSSDTPSQGALNWGSHVSTCTFSWVYT